MTDRQRHAAVRAAYARWTETWSPPLGRHRGPCGLCGAPDARHRVADAMVERYLAGDDLKLIAYDYDAAQPELAELVTAGLAYEIARRRARIPRNFDVDKPEAIDPELGVARVHRGPP